MTPFGEKLRQLRDERNITLSQMANAIGVTPTYLSALEHGRRGKPTWSLLQRIIGYFNIIWDDADELQTLADISDPRITIYTAGLSPKATKMANLLARKISNLSESDLEAHIVLLESNVKAARR